MKVSINYEVVNRIWGGGNKFVISLIDQLKKIIMMLYIT